MRVKADIAEDAGQQIVEIVGDASGKHAQALELLRVSQLAIHLLPHLLFALRDRHVAAHRHEAGRPRPKNPGRPICS